MSVIAKAIADRQSEIERLQVEIKALNEVDKILGTSAPPAKPAARRSSSRRTAAAATPVAETPPDAKPTRKRRAMSAEEKNAVSERMTAYWAERRKKAAKAVRTLTQINLPSFAICGLFGFYAAQRGTGGHDCRQVRGGVAGIG